MENFNIKETKNIQFTLIELMAEGANIRWDENVIVQYLDKDTGSLIEQKKYLKKCGNNYNRKPHADFYNSMKMLRKPAMQMCELGDFARFNQYGVNKAHFSDMDADDTASVILSCVKELENGLVWSFNTPLTPLNNENVKFDSETLDSLCAKVCDQAKLYVFEAKYSQRAQLTLGLKLGEVDPNKPEENVKKKKTAKEKKVETDPADTDDIGLDTAMTMAK